MGCKNKNPKKQFDLNIRGTSGKFAMVWGIWRLTIAEIFPLFNPILTHQG
jgi:hypothetical protein